MGAEATQISAFTAAAAHALCFVGLAAAHYLAGRGALVSDPALTLRHLVVCEALLVIAVFSLLRRDPKRCSFLKVAARGLLGLPVGAFLNAFGAIVLGAPVGIKYWTETAYWSLLMSLFTFVPAACVFGASKGDWQNGLSHSMFIQVEDLVGKDREMQEKLMTRHSTVVDSFEKKLREQDIENRIASQQQKIAALRQEVESLLEYISEI